MIDKVHSILCEILCDIDSTHIHVGQHGQLFSISIPKYKTFSIHEHELIRNNNPHQVKDLLRGRLELTGDTKKRSIMPEEVAKWWLSWYTQIDWSRARCQQD